MWDSESRDPGSNPGSAIPFFKKTKSPYNRKNIFKLNKIKIIITCLDSIVAKYVALSRKIDYSK